jgi:hypothetical protein
MRVWVKMTGEPDVSQIAAAMTSISGSVTTSPIAATVTFNRRQMRVPGVRTSISGCRRSIERSASVTARARQRKGRARAVRRDAFT